MNSRVSEFLVNVVYNIACQLLVNMCAAEVI